MNRRQFFHPRRLARTAVQFSGFLDSIANLSPPETEASFLRFSRPAMATTFEAILPFGTVQASNAAQAALDLIDCLEDQMTVYRETSEVSRINRLAAQQPVPVEENLFDLLDLGHDLWEETAGAFDISVGALIKAWGFFRRQGRVPSAEERMEVMDRVGMTHVALDREKKTVVFHRDGLEINLGSIGKGHALDRAGRLLRNQWGIGTALLHGGQSSVLALGSRPGSRRGWPVGILHPEVSGRRLGQLWLKDRALGTSAATFQHLQYHGRKLGHILDPRTGWPAEGILSASVTAPSAAVADALATAFFILGAEQAGAFCQRYPQIGAVLLSRESGEPLVLGHAREEMD